MPDKDRALLIVDVQNGFVNEHSKHIPKLVETLQNEYEHVFATQFYNPENSNFRRLINWERFREGSNDTKLAFVPAEHVNVIPKPIYSCVTPCFLDKLNKRGISVVDVCGIDTDICVTKCAVDLFEVGLTPFVLEKYCASHAGRAAHDFAIGTLRRFIGKGQVI